jgi:O-antigen ligase
MMPVKTDMLSTRIGRGGLYLFAFSMWLSTAGAHIGLGLMMLAALADRTARNALRRDAMVKLSLLFAGYLLAYALWAAVTTAESYILLWNDSWQWLRLFLFFIFVAWWLAGDERRIGIALLLALAGLLLKMLLAIETAGWHALLSGQRIGFGLPVNSFGLYSATALLGALVLGPRLWGFSGRLQPAAFLRCIAWCLAVALLIQGLITSQSRDAWLATLIVFLPVLLLRLAGPLCKMNGLSRLRAGIALSLILLLAGAVTVHNLDTIEQRVLDEQASWQAFLAGDFDSMPHGSIGDRVRLVEYGLQKWQEHPVIGWGPHSYRTLIAQTEDIKLRRMPHLHNAYVETLVTLGIVGALFYLYAMGSLGATIYRSVRQGRLPADYALFLSGGFCLLLIWCLASFGLNQVTWNFYFAMLAGTVYSYRMRSISEATVADPYAGMASRQSRRPVA